MSLESCEKVKICGREVVSGVLLEPHGVVYDFGMCGFVVQVKRFWYIAIGIRCKDGSVLAEIVA